MKKGISLLLFILFCMPVSSMAVDALKIGCIEFQKVLNESDAGKKAKADLEILVKSKQTTIDEKGKTIEKMKADLEKQASVLSAEAKKSKEEELEKVLREYQRLVQDSQTEVKKKELELTDTIIKDMRQLVEKIGEEGGYTLIMEKTGGMVLYSTKDIDLTDAVIKRYNQSKK
jgi:outer membrane protein